MVFVFTIYGDPSSGLGDSDTVYDKLQGIIQWTPKMKCDSHVFMMPCVSMLLPNDTV